MLRVESDGFFAAISSRPSNGFVSPKNIINKSVAYTIDEDARLNFRAVEDYDDDAHGLIAKKGERNQELINGW